MIHTLRPAKERLQRNLSLHAGTTLRRALFNAFNEQPSVLPVLEEDKPTNVRVSAPDMPTNVRVSDIPTNVRVSDIPTNVRVSDKPTNVRVSDKPTNVRVYEDDAVTNVVVTDPERVRSREERNDALEEEDAVDSVRTTLDESMMRQTCEPLPQIREEESEATEPELPPIAVMESIPKEATHSGHGARHAATAGAQAGHGGRGQHGGAELPPGAARHRAREGVPAAGARGEPGGEREGGEDEGEAHDPPPEGRP